MSNKMDHPAGRAFVFIFGGFLLYATVKIFLNPTPDMVKCLAESREPMTIRDKISQTWNSDSRIGPGRRLTESEIEDLHAYQSELYSECKRRWARK